MGLIPPHAEDFYPREVRDAAFFEIAEVARNRSLDYDEARSAMAAMAEGRPSPHEIAALLLAPSMSAAEATAETMLGLVEEVRARAVRISPRTADGLGDTCGTGGGFPTFNVSTAAALLAASQGCPIAKHGNRAIASRAGSADVLEALGIPIEAAPGDVEAGINRHGFGFLFAPKFHRAFSHVMPVRRKLAEAGIRTVFNCIGPLANPAPVDRQVVGVYDAGLLPRAAEVLARLGLGGRPGLARALVVHGTVQESGEPLDEISTLGPTRIVEISRGAAGRPFIVTPEELGLSRARAEDVRGGTAQENAVRIRKILAGQESGAGADLVAATAGAIFLLFGRAKDLAAGAALAREALARGDAARLLEALTTS